MSENLLNFTSVKEKKYWVFLRLDALIAIKHTISKFFRERLNSHSDKQEQAKLLCMAVQQRSNHPSDHHQSQVDTKNIQISKSGC
jgi:hypothetical protein